MTTTRADGPPGSAGRTGRAGTGGRGGLSPERRRQDRMRNLVAYAYMSPWIVGTVVFLAGPLVFSLYLSFTDYSLGIPARWVGLGNFQEMVAEDFRFWLSLRITGVYLVLSVPIYMLFGLLGALLLNQKVWGIRTFRTILFLPSVLSGVAVAVLWQQLLNPDVGVVNSLLRTMGVANPPGWFNDPGWAVPAMVVTGLWGVVGGGAIIYLAGLQNISPGLYESAMIDGAGTLRRFWHVTLPMLTPTLFFTLLTSIIGAFQIFDTAYTIGGANGGTGNSLLFYLLYVWQAGFRDGRLGYAAALSWVLFVIGALVVVVLMRTSERWVYYENEAR
jgi:multiple sugar transport system permease protein